MSMVFWIVTSDVSEEHTIYIFSVHVLAKHETMRSSGYDKFSLPSVSASKAEATGSCETSGCLRTTWRSNPEYRTAASS